MRFTFTAGINRSDKETPAYALRMLIPESPQGVAFIHATLLSDRIKQLNRRSVKVLPSSAENQLFIKNCKFHENIYSAQRIDMQIVPRADNRHLFRARRYMKNNIKINLLQDILLRNINIYKNSKYTFRITSKTTNNK